jgi:hypothetical protein
LAMARNVARAEGYTTGMLWKSAITCRVQGMWAKRILRVYTKGRHIHGPHQQYLAAMSSSGSGAYGGRMRILADSRRLAQPTAPRVHARVRSGVPISISISCVSSRIAGGSPSQPPPESTPESAQAYLFLFLFLPCPHLQIRNKDANGRAAPLSMRVTRVVPRRAIRAIVFQTICAATATARACPPARHGIRSRALYDRRQLEAQMRFVASSQIRGSRCRVLIHRHGHERTCAGDSMLASRASLRVLRAHAQSS